MVMEVDQKVSQVFVLVGSNLGKREVFIDQAACLLNEEKTCEIIRVSKVYESKPWGFDSENTFLNQGWLVGTTKKPMDFLHVLLSIEKKLGRVREKGGYTSRTIDLDILFWENLQMEHPDLTIPHALVERRMFALQPANELIPHWLHSKLNKTVSELYQLLKNAP